MSKFLLFIYIILLSGYSNSQQWEKVVSGSLPDLNSICFTDENTGFAVGLGGTIIKSTDGGQNWEAKQSGISANLNHIFFLNSNIGFAVGQGRTLLHTYDNGETWVVNSINVLNNSKANLKKIYFEDEKNGWTIAAANDTSWILHTNDGGVNWAIDHIIKGELHDISFYNGKGIVTGKRADEIYYTEDGVNWVKSSEPLNWDPNLYPKKSDVRVIFMNANVVYAAGWGFPGQPTIYLKSTDGGITWEYIAQDEENRTYDNLYGIYFKDEFNGIAVGGDNTTGVLVTKTIDSGVIWKKVEAILGGYAKSIFGKGDTLWICGTGGLIASSVDFGLTWNSHTLPNVILGAIDFTSKNIAYAGGKNGVLFKTEDGGANWSSSFLYNGSSVTEILDLDFLNENIGFAGFSNRTLSKTFDGGTTWNVIISDTTEGNATINSVFFLNEDLGFTAGLKSKDYDNIFKTTDGGINWESKDSLVGKELNCVRFYDEMHGVVVGSSKKILYTSDGGETWNAPAAINDTTGKFPSINSVAYANKDLLYAVGGNAIYRSTDGGLNWDYVDLPEKKTWNSIKFYDSTTGYMVGANYIMKTTDAGYSWTNIADSVITGTLYDIDIDDKGFVWVCGNNSSIYTNKDFTSDIAATELPNEFQLAQNYPNPFNPSTTIVFSIPVQGMVELKVFDLLGQEVKTLVNEIQQAGTHRVSFNAVNLSSGIYFYTIKYNNLLQSRKMTLIK